LVNECVRRKAVFGTLIILRLKHKIILYFTVLEICVERNTIYNITLYYNMLINKLKAELYVKTL